MSDSIVTNIAKKKIVQARAGLIPALPKTIGMAFGDGAASGSAVRTPLATDTSLQHELHRQRVDGVTLQPDEISAMYVTTLAKETLAGQTINEAVRARDLQRGRTDCQAGRADVKTELKSEEEQGIYE